MTHVVPVCKRLEMHCALSPNSEFPVQALDLAVVGWSSMAARREKAVVREQK